MNKRWVRLLGIVVICATFITAPVLIPETEAGCGGPHTFTLKVPFATCETLCMGCSWDENGNWQGCGCVMMAECIC